jgi:CRP-like cAMP-binding protein
MTIETIAQLKKSFLFQGMPEDALVIIAEKISTQELNAGEALFNKGDEGDALFMIDEGYLDIVTEDSQGSTLVLNQCGPGETIGEMSLIDEEPRSAGVIANTDAHILALKRGDFFDMLETNPATANLLIRKISGRLRFATTYIEKATDWSRRIAEGDYKSALKEIESSKSDNTDEISNEDKANQLLAAFFQMIEEVQAREDALKKEIQKLNFEIDQSKRKQEYEELTKSEFYTDLKAQAARLRQQREERAKIFANKSQETK